MTDIPTSLKEMFNGMDGSPKTTLTEPFIPGSSIEINVNNASYLPDAPNLCTISTSINNSNWYLVIKYETKSGNVLSGLTVLYGNPSNTITCPKGSFCFRGYNEYDQNTFIYNINMMYQLLKDISVTIKPEILSFNIPDLPSIVSIRTSYVGNHTFDHNESYSIYVWETLKLYEDEVEIGEALPSETIISSPFTSGKVFDEIGSHTYQISGIDSFGRIFESDVQTVNVVIPMYYGSIEYDTITSETFDLLTESNNCYTGMDLSILSENNEYIWICIINTKTISTITSDGFDIPIEDSTTLSKTINGVNITFNCYRITSPVVAGINELVIHLTQ